MRNPLALLRMIYTRVDRRVLDRDMDEEMALHIDLYAADLEKQGLSHDEARRRAVVEFGGVQRYREEGREARALSWLHDLFADLRYGLRSLRRAPGFATAAVASLALGIGANTAVFGLLYGVLMQPLAIPRPGELTAVAIEVKGDVYATVLRRTYLQLRALPGAPDFEAIHEADNVVAEANGARDYIRAALVEGGFFPLLGVEPSLGRYITADDATRDAPVAVISDGVWRDYFARSRDVLGRRLLLHGHPFTIVGVMPASFRGVRFNASFTLAVPASAGPLLGVSEERDYVDVVTRASESERAALVAPLDSLLHRCCREAGEASADAHLLLIDASKGIPFGKSDFRGDYRLVLWSLMGGVFLVLLVACSNVGNLLLARGTARSRELGVRLSLGASRGRIVRQLLAESALLAIAGAALGVALAAWCTALLVHALPGGFNDAIALVEFRAKPVILAFTTGISVLCVIAFGLGPALRCTRADLVAILRDGAGARSRDTRLIDRVLVVGQIAVTLVLVCGAGLFVATLRNLRSIDRGFATNNLVAVMVETRGSEFERGGIMPIHADMLARARAVPGVAFAAMATRVPAIGGRNLTFAYSVDGQSRTDNEELSVSAVTPGYFAAMRTPLVAGRDVATSDRPGAELAAVVNEAFVRKHFAAGSPHGARVQLDGFNGGETVTIVGVVRDVRLGDGRSPADPTLYVPALQGGNWPFMLLVMRTAREPHAVANAVIRSLGPYARALRVTRPQTMDEAFDEVLLRERLAAALASICAALSLALAMVGLSGLIAFSVSRRTREIGVRMALGARRSEVIWIVLRGTLVMAVLGVLLGGPLALAAGHALGALLYGIAPANFSLMLGAVVLLLVVSVVASAAPAWRAARVDPSIALRAE
jgi:predicted permease